MEQCEPNTRSTFGWKANVQMIHFGWFQIRSARLSPPICFIWFSYTNTA